MRPVLLLALGVSLSAHALVAAALLMRGAAPDLAADPAPGSIPLFAGETFELPAPDLAGPPARSDAPEPASEAHGEAPAEESERAPARRARRRAKARPASEGGGDPGGSPDAAPALYGAVGERSAADLATAFTRGFPQAASSDPAWRSAPLGAAGEAEVRITIDADGRIRDHDVLGSPSPALASGIRRTLALIGGRPFVARAMTTRLRIRATVGTDTIRDAVHGDVFAIGGSFAGGEGTAFFSLAIGRRIDLRVRAE